MDAANTFAARLRALSQAASEAPWTDGVGDGCRSIYAGPFAETVVEAAGQSPALDRANAAAIVFLRNHADRLADLVERVAQYRAMVGDAVLPTTTTDKGIAIYAAKSAMLAALDALGGGE